jgi:hypothetical protein
MSNQYIVNGKTYNSLDEMPPDVRATYEAMGNLFADKNQNGVPDILEGTMNAGITVISTPTIIYEGKTYTNVNDLPPEARAKYDAALAKLADNNQNGVPNALAHATTGQTPIVVSTAIRTANPSASAPAASGQNIGPIIVLSIVALALAIIVAILLWLLWMHRGG